MVEVKLLEDAVDLFSELFIAHGVVFALAD